MRLFSGVGIKVDQRLANGIDERRTRKGRDVGRQIVSRDGIANEAQRRMRVASAERVIKLAAQNRPAQSIGPNLRPNSAEKSPVRKAGMWHGAA